MKKCTQFAILSMTILIGFVQIAKAQTSVLNPDDPVITYDSSHKPVEPPFGQIAKWVRTVRLNWNTDMYKAYIYKGVSFRLKFPKTYNPAAADGKRYPMFVFFHGLGETGNIYDNEFHLYHGAQDFANRVQNGIFDGYVIFMQSQGFFGGGHYQYIKEIIDYMVINNKLDPFQVVDNGLSAGAQASWEMLINYPTYISGAMPMSGVSIGYKDPPVPNIIKYTPIWNFNGGKDASLAPSTCDQVRDAILAVGGNYRNTLYPELGHGTWNTAWTENDFWPFVNRAYSSNPWPLFGRTEFCPSDAINVTLGLTAGYNTYQWRKDGVVISTATTNTLQVTQTGTYDARVLRGSVWSDWSHTPVVIKRKAITVTPNIAIAGVMSKVLPTLDTNKSVKLQIPAGYATYAWQKVGNSATLSTTNTLNATSPGDYTVIVTEQYGCSSTPSAPFAVIDANGPNKPSAAGNLLASTLSKTSVRLNWSDNTAPQFNETGYEIYQGTQPGGPYTYVATTAADASVYTVTDLHANTKYYFKVRGVNNTGASPASNEANATTPSDVNAPTAPSNLVISSVAKAAITISWSPSTDDVGVTNYEVYVNGLKSYITSQTQFTVSNLDFGQVYNMSVKAKDFAGNVSPASNQVTGQPLSNGLKYRYFTGAWTQLPDFNALTPVATGYMPNISLESRTRDDNFAFLWEGYIKVPVTGTYTFGTYSDDGTRVYIGPYSASATPLVDNDGVHAPTIKTGTIFLTAGLHPIAISYFNANSSQYFLIGWITPLTANNFELIPNSAFAEAPPVVNGLPPAAPANLEATAVSYKRIDLKWQDNSNNETGFEVYRSLSSSSGFTTIGVALPNSTTFADSTLNPGTLYHYRLRAIGANGESGFTSSTNEATWNFNNNLADAGGNHTLTVASGPTFDAGSKMEGTHSAYFDGTNQFATIGNEGSFLQDAHTEKTVAFWMKSSFDVGVRLITDMGGNDNGLCIALYQNILYAGLASNHVLNIISAPYSSTDWNHVAVVYKQNTLRMYINGLEVASNLNMNVSSLGSTTDGSGIGQTIGTNAFNIPNEPYRGWLDNLGIYRAALSAADINALKNQTYTDFRSFATTLAAPPLPLAPTNLVASAISPSSLSVTWTDNATTEDKYEVYRSGNNIDFTLLASLPANSTSLVDTALFSNTTYYYKVSAVGVSGSSGNLVAFAKTKNNNPAISKITDRSARYGATTIIPLTASDSDVEALSFTIQNKPSFATFVDNGNKTATLTLNPAAANQAVYSGVRIIVNDTNGGADTTTFNLTVNDNFDPVLTAVPDYVMDENSILNIPLSATDQNAADVLAWSVTGSPNVFSLIPGTNGANTLRVQPNFAAAGEYMVQVNVADGRGGSAVRSFKLTVNDKDPSTKIYIQFPAQGTAGAPWNSVTGTTASNLKDASNNNTGVGLAFQPSWWWATYYGGPQTGNNSGVYADLVLRDYFYFGIFGGPETVSATLNGLDPNRFYNLSFYAGSTWTGVPDNGSTTYTIGSQTVTLYVQNNTQNTVSINNVKPAANGTITFTMGKAANTAVGYLSAVVITSLFDDGSVPVMPQTLAAQNVSGQGVQLSWKDVAYNETGYEVYRSQTAGGTFAKVGSSTSSNATSFVDSTANGNLVYYYKVRAINSYGQSAFTDAVSITTINRVPQINAISDVALKNNEQRIVSVTAVDDASDQVRLTASGLPPFVTFTDNGNGTGTINIVPTSGSTGAYTGITITATDNANASRSVSFDISVVDKDISSVYLNFSDGSVAGKPWNNLSGWPFPGATYANLLDDGNNPSGISVTYVEGFEGILPTGMRPNNGKSVYPEVVMRTALVESSTNTKSIRVSGLSSGKKYNFVFFNSREDGLNGLTEFTINGQTVTLSANYNINKTVQINGISPDANGQVLISMKKGAGAYYGFLSSLVIQMYNSSLTLLNPVELRTTDTRRNSVSLQWADRSYTETGFEVWRASDNAGSQYALVATVGANVTSYTNLNLSPNKTYYYIVRAVNGGTYSSYSNVVVANTSAYSISVNFTISNQAPTPWNNLNAPPEVGYTWNNFIDDLGNLSGTGMVITKPFAGLQPLGMNTGNNSGIYPDKVMMDDYILFPGEKGGVEITGLNVSMKYNLTFFGSTQAWGDYTTAYTINNKTVYLDGSLNTTGTVTFYDVAPDANGNINIDVAPLGNSAGGLINALVLHGYNASSGASAPQLPGGASVMSNTMVVTSESVASGNVAEEQNLGAYPNPFKDQFTLSVPSQRNEGAQVSIYDVNGKLVYRNQYNNLVRGNNYLRINGSQTLIKPGVYLVKVLFMNSKTTKVIKMIKD